MPAGIWPARDCTSAFDWAMIIRFCVVGKSKQICMGWLEKSHARDWHRNSFAAGTTKHRRVKIPLRCDVQRLDAGAVAYLAIALMLSTWIIRELGREPTYAACNAAGLKSSDRRLPVAVGIALMIGMVVSTNIFGCHCSRLSPAARSGWIAQRLMRRIRHPFGRQVSRPLAACQLLRIPPVVLSRSLTFTGNGVGSATAAGFSRFEAQPALYSSEAGRSMVTG
jgi:hypothetical protein